MNFNKIPETNEIKKSKAICPLCYGNGDVPVENPKTGVWEMMPCPKCAEINTKIDAKSAEIPAVEVLEEAAKTPNEPVIFVENGKQFKDQARAKAIEQAKGNAQNLAKESGIKLGKLINVYENSSSYYPAVYNSAKAMGGAALDEASVPTIQSG